MTRLWAFGGLANGRASTTNQPLRHARKGRKGVAAVELAVLLPLLVFLFLITIDFARVYYFSLTLTNCARAGAMYASDPAVAHESPFADVQEAALADATNISPAPTITQTQGTDASGRLYVEVTASYTFSTITGFPGIPNNLALTRSVKMYVAANTPTNY
jgi:Flp pilus assembly protein TadG